MGISKKIVLIGAGGHGLVLADIAKLNGYDEIVFLDDAENKKYPYRIIGSISTIEKYIGGYDFFISLWNKEIRAKLFDQIVRVNGKLVNLIHPSSVIAADVLLGKGVAIMANVVINSKTEINDGCIINTLSSVDHENKIGKFVHISPGCHLSGKVQIGAKCWLGTGCNVVNNILICEESIIGAGSVIIKDIVEPGTYVGVPSKRVKR